ncbi:hypothetical protein BC939DRAFT_88999 [Gamsiella multidivaricata]|uniref:uncharacterized protein n=1 Tax=Gamsiella multidivaricata TaxID=101098 RepID=UPI00221ECE07|nr:uncharacterized protein BC939DRAFT_88999 [Gamsiella multidivaricata]KAI7815763.1 hypothetical protein BC939DRAFT_88999 [Gamsiella multidivaricata]
MCGGLLKFPQHVVKLYAGRERLCLRKHSMYRFCIRKRTLTWLLIMVMLMNVVECSETYACVRVDKWRVDKWRVDKWRVDEWRVWCKGACNSYMNENDYVLVVLSGLSL